MKSVLALLSFFFLYSAQCQTLWNIKIPINGNLNFQLTEPIEWNGNYYAFSRDVHSLFSVEGNLRKIDPNGNILKYLNTDSIAFFMNRVTGVSAILDTASVTPKLSLIADCSSPSQTLYLKVDLDENLNVISTDSLKCVSCSSLYPQNLGQGILLGPTEFVLIGITNAQGTMLKLNFSTKEVQQFINPGDWTTALAYNPLKHIINDTLFILTQDQFYGRLNFYNSDLVKKTQKDNLFHSSPSQSNISYYNLDGRSLSNERLLSAGIFLDFDFNDSGRVGLMLRDSDASILDTMALASTAGRWYEWVDFDFQDTNSIFVAGSQLLNLGIIPNFGHVDVHKVSLGGQRHWTVTLGRKRGYQILHIKATSDGGVLLFTRFYEMGSWYIELIKMDGQGNFLSQSEIPLQKAFSIYPNPATDYLILQSEQVNAPSTQVRLLDLLGKEVWRAECTQAHYGCKLNLPPLAQGMYQLQLLQENRIVGQEKLILQP